MYSSRRFEGAPSASRGGAVGVVDAEAQPGRFAVGARVVAEPHHLPAGGERAAPAGGADGRGLAHAVVGAERRGGVRTDGERGHGGLRQAALVHHVAEQGPGARLQLRRCAGAEARRFDLLGVKMQHAVERGRAHREQVHQVIVVGDQIVETAGLEPARIAQRQIELPDVEGEARLEHDGPVHVPFVAGRFGAPPRVAAPHRQADHHRGADHRGARAGAAARIGRLRRVELPFAHAGADDRDDAGAEQEAEQQQDRAQAALHRLGAQRERGHRNAQLARSGHIVWAFGGDAHLPRARRHHPQARHPGVGRAGDGLGLVGRGREAGPLAGERHGDELDALDAAGRRLHVDLRHAGDHLGRLDAHEERVIAGVAFVHDVGAADVRVRQGRSEQ